MATATARAGRCCSTPSPRAPKTYRTSFKTSGTIGRQTSSRGTDQRTSSTRAASGEAVDRAKEWLGWSPIDREADGYGYEDQREDNVPLDDSTWGECGEGRLADDRRLQDMVDATPAVVIRCAWEADGRVGNSKHGILRRRCFQRGIRPRPCRGLCHRVAGAGERPGAHPPKLPEPAPAVTTCEANEAYLVSYPGYRKGLQEELWDEWKTNQDSAAQGAGPSGAQEVGRSERQAKRQCR